MEENKKPLPESETNGLPDGMPTPPIPDEKPLSKRKQKALEKKARLKAMTIGQRVWYEIKDWGLSILIAVVAVMLLKTFIGIPIRVDGHSMDSTLGDGERLLVTAYDVNIYNGLEKGDVVICHYPGRTTERLGFITLRTDFVKRIVGMPGDTVKRVKGVTYINGKALDPRGGRSVSYTYEKAEDGTLTYFANGRPIDIAYEDTLRYNFDYEYTLGKDEYFVVGDNRYNSHDSRAWNGPDLYYYQTNDPSGHVGPVKKDDITGHVRAVIWPLDLIRGIGCDPDYIDPRDSDVLR